MAAGVASAADHGDSAGGEVSLSACRAGFRFSDAVIRCSALARLAEVPALMAKLRGALWEDLGSGASADAVAGHPCPWVPPCALDVLWRARDEIRPGYPMPVPWVFETDAEGDDLLVTLRLFGDAADYLAEASDAVIRGLRRGPSGIGPMEVTDRQFGHAAGLPPLTAQKGVLLRFVTPLLLRHEQTAHVDPHALLRSLVHRTEGVLWWSGHSIARKIPGLIELVGQVEGLWLESEADSWTRFSNSQDKRLRMEGMTGLLMLRGPAISGLADLLAIGSVTHAGGRTAFGQGRFRIEAFE
jgi:hypothetical protein